VKVKAEFALPDRRLDSNKALTAFPGDSLVNDVWDLELYIPRDNAHGGNGNYLVGAHGETDPLILGIDDALRRVTRMCQLHFENQRKLIQKGEGLVASRCYCPTCKLAQSICSCEIDAEITEFSSSLMSELQGFGFTDEEEDEEQASFEETFDWVRTQFESIGGRTNQFLALMPNWVFMNPVITRAYLLCHGREFLQYERTVRYATLMSLFVFWLATICSSCFQWAFVPICELALHLFFYYAMLARWRDVKLSQLARRRDLTIDIFASIRQSKVIQFISFCVIAKVLHSFVTMFRGAVAIQQSALAPSNVEEIAKRDAEENPWATAVVEELHVSSKACNMTHDQVVSEVRKNLCHGTFVENAFQQSCDLLALGGNVFLMPLHLFKNRKDMKALITRKDPTQLNSTFRALRS